MPHTFSARDVERLLGDTRDLLSQVLDHEHRLSTLLEALEHSSSASDASNGSSTTVVAAVRQLCLAAREQRLHVQGLRHWLGDSMHVSAADPSYPAVLVVDDSEDTRHMIATALESAGLYVTTAANGLEAIVAAHNTMPAVVLMDLNMSVMGGMEAARLLKASPVTRDVKIVAYTALAESLDHTASELFAGVLRKPTLPASVVDLIRRLLD